MTITALILVGFMGGIFAIMTIGGVLAYAIDARVDHGH